MVVKNTELKYLLSPETVANFIGVKTDKYVSIDKASFTHSIEEAREEFAGWEDGELDGRKLRRIKKPLLKEFGDNLLKSYGETDRIYEILSKKFINMSGVSSVLKNGVANNMNIIMYGAGGFGKSEVCSELFGVPELRDRVFIQSLNESTTEEDLFGGIKMKKFMDTGAKEFLVENSFANYEIVIFEEIFDAPARVLAALKDTLTSKTVRNGSQQFPIKTKLIIGLTNKTYEEVIEDDSTEALTQRFPISYKMEYEVSKLTTAGLILNRYEEYDEMKACAIIESSDSSGKTTPRKVLEMAKYIKGLEVHKKKMYSEKITNNSIAQVVNYIKIKKNPKLDDILSSELIKASKAIKEERVDDYDSMVDIRHIASIIEGKPGMTVSQKAAAEIIKLINDKLAA